MRTEHGAEQVVGVADVAHPVEHGYADRVFQRAASGVHGVHLGAEQPNPEHVQRLPIHVVSAHVDMTIEAEQSANGCRGETMLPGAGFGDNATLAHPMREQSLTQGVVRSCAHRCGRGLRA